MATALLVVGCGQLLLVLASLWLPRVLGWRRQLAALEPLTRRVFWVYAGHILGTCRMGADAATSVVDANGRSHDHPTLFIVGSSVFPTGGTANPTLTALALTLRANRTISSDLEQGAFAH